MKSIFIQAFDAVKLSEQKKQETISKLIKHNTDTQIKNSEKFKRRFNRSANKTLIAISAAAVIIATVLCAVLIPYFSTNGSRGYYSVSAAKLNDISDSITYTFGLSPNMDLSVSIGVSASGQSSESNIRMITNDNKMYGELSDSNGYNSVMYVIEDFLYTKDNGNIKVERVQEAEDTELISIDNYLSDNYVSANFDFEKNGYKFNTKALSGGKLRYFIDIENYDFSEMITGFTDSGLGGYFKNCNLSFEFTVNNKTRVWESMEYSFSTGKNSEAITISLGIYLRDLGDHLRLVIPQEVYSAINFYKDDIRWSPDHWNQQLEIQDGGYVNTSDGAVKYYELGEFKAVTYDRSTGKFAVLRNKSVDIYNGENLNLIKTISFNSAADCLDSDNGKLAVGFGEGCHVRVYDLNDYTEISRFSIDLTPEWLNEKLKVTEIVIDGDTVIAADNKGYNVFSYNITTEHCFEIINPRTDYSAPKLAINREDHILYIVESNSFPGALVYVDSQTGKELVRTVAGNFSGNENFIFDGMYLHFRGAVYDKNFGSIISSNNLNKDYNKLLGFSEKRTVLDSTPLSLVFGFGEDPKVGVYDNVLNKYVYVFDFYAGEKTGVMDNTKLFLVSGANKYLAIMNLERIDVDFGQLVTPKQDQGTLVSDKDGVQTYRNYGAYTLSCADGEYIYLLNEFSKYLYVYDDTFSLVYSEQLALFPCFADAYGGKLAIAFGEARQVWLYDTISWSKEIFTLQFPVEQAYIYNDSFIYTSGVLGNGMIFGDHIYRYDIATGSEAWLLHNGPGYHKDYPIMACDATIALNRAEGILYVGNRNLSNNEVIYYDIAAGQIIYASAHSSLGIYYKGSVTFDGNFVHYDGRVFDKTSGAILAQSDKSRNYIGCGMYMNVETVFDNQEISIFRANYDGERVTVIYDVINNKVLYCGNFSCSNAFIIGDKIMLFANGSEYVRIV